jgi:hypothetical protein
MLDRLDYTRGVERSTECCLPTEAGFRYLDCEVLVLELSKEIAKPDSDSSLAVRYSILD